MHINSKFGVMIFDKVKDLESITSFGKYTKCVVVVFNATFNNISVILVEETGVPDDREPEYPTTGNRSTRRQETRVPDDRKPEYTPTGAYSSQGKTTPNGIFYDRPEFL